MKQFTNAGRKEQEGRELIPAHPNAEEEGPLGLSFEGGLTAGPRRYSRRQAIGLLGGSLAGASLASLGLAAPAKSQPLPPFRSYDHITLEFVGTAVPSQSNPQNRFFLDGRTQDGTVGLAPHTNPPFTGTRWEVSERLGSWPRYSRWAFKCLGDIPGPRWLDGRTANSTVGLAPHGGQPYTGTRWEVVVPEPVGIFGPNRVYIKCLGHIPGVPYLAAFPSRPPNSTVGLSALSKEHALWRVRILPK